MTSPRTNSPLPTGGLRLSLWYGTSVSSDTKWIIGTVIGAVVAMTGVVVSVMAILEVDPILRTGVRHS